MAIRVLLCLENLLVPRPSDVDGFQWFIDELA